jgi:PAS domain S-box-containing protein
MLNLHHTLAQQLRRHCGIESEAQWQAVLDALSPPGAVPAPLAGVLAGLGPLIERISHTYELHERDLQRREAAQLELLNQRFALDQHAIVSIADTRRHIVYVNDNFCRVTGYSRDELLGGSYAVLDSGQHGAVYFDEVWRTVESGRVWHGEVHNRSKDGRPYCVHATMVPFLDADGMPYQYISIETDISENKFLSEIVATSERQYRALVNSLQEVVFQTDARGCWSFVNPAWSRISGYSMDQTLGRCFVEFLPPEDQGVAWRRFARAMAGRGLPLRREIRCRCRDGSLRWLELHVRAEFGDDGVATGLSGTLQDVTARHRAAQQIREHLSFVDALFDSIPLPISLKDADGRYLRINPAYAQFFDTSEEWLRGKSLHDVMLPASAEVHITRDRQVLDSGTPQIYQDSFQLRNGRQVDIQVSKAVLRRTDGRADGVIGVTVDLSAQTAAVRALQQAKAAADDASQAKSDFLANMSHEIRTPLNSVNGMALLALKTELAPKQRDYLNKILLSGEHLLALIDDMLDFSKIEAGMLTLEHAAFDLELVLANVLAQVAARAGAKGLQLDSVVAPEVACRVRGDSLRLSQVLINLVGNAVKFTDTGAVSMRVELQAADPAASRLRFEVCDSGIGMSEAQVAKLFQPFQQADSSITRKYGGTGLGLAISKRLVQQMGGQIGVDSAPGRGSCFWFTLRLEHDTAPAPLPAAASAAAPPPQLRGRRVLVVDDHEFNQQVAREFLEEVGVRVTVAGNGLEALALLARLPFDCVLMDLQMPVLDGVATVIRMRADPALAALPVIAMTANAGRQERERCLAAGMTDFVSKPVAPQALYAAVAGQTAAAPPPATAADPAGTDPAAPAPVIERAELARHFSHKPERMRQFALRYVETASRGMAEATAALAQGDRAGLAALGHRHQSSARAVGALAMAQQWLALERLGGHDDDLAEAAALVAGLAPALARVEQWIAAELPPAAG